jgi:sugar phosphate isomerase/epimerase
MTGPHIGNQTAFHVRPLSPFAFAVEHGFDAFEFFPDGKAGGPGWASADLSPATRRQIRSAAEEHGMRLSVHATLDAEPSGELFWADVELARDIGARVVNTHLPARAEPGFAAAALAAAGRLCVDGLTLAFENTVALGPDAVNRFFAELRTRGPGGARGVGLCLDIGHASLYPGTRKRFLDYLDLVDAEVPIVHVHAHENWGDSDSHLPLFTGPAGRDDTAVWGLMQRLHARGFAGSIILEQWPNPPELLATAFMRLRDIATASAGQGQP